MGGLQLTPSDLQEKAFHEACVMLRLYHGKQLELIDCEVLSIVLQQNSHFDTYGHLFPKSIW